MRAIDRIKKAVSMSQSRRGVELPDGSMFEFWMTPLTLSERAKAQKNAKSDDATDFALQLLVSKARDENNRPMFHQGDLAELRNELPASVVEAIMLKLIEDEVEEEEAEADMKSAEEPTKRRRAAAS
jgi:hypothetical protein